MPDNKEILVKSVYINVGTLYPVQGSLCHAVANQYLGIKDNRYILGIVPYETIRDLMLAGF